MRRGPTRGFMIPLRGTNSIFLRVSLCPKYATGLYARARQIQTESMQLFLLVLAALLFSFGGLAMKASAGLTRVGPTLALFALFCGGAASQALGMRRAEMGVVYITVLGLEAVSAFALSWLALGERATISKVCALLLIVGGIALLERQ